MYNIKHKQVEKKETAISVSFPLNAMPRHAKCKKELSCFIDRAPSRYQLPISSHLFYIAPRTTRHHVLPPSPAVSLQHGDQQDKNNNEDDDGDHLLALARGARDLADLAAGAVEAALVAVDGAVHVVEHGDVLVELVADPHRELALPRDADPELVQLLVLLVQDLLVVRVDLRVGHAVRLVPVPHAPVVRVISVPAAAPE